MDFTREPIIETVITPREGYRLVVRSSKGAGYEEHFVDALEVVAFGSSVFFRCLERPKPFIVPVADYEVLEVREPRMVLKTPSESKGEKGERGERGATHKARQESRQDSRQERQERQEKERQETRQEPQRADAGAELEPGAERAPATAHPQEMRQEGREGRSRGRRQRFRRRRGQNRDEVPREEQSQEPGQEPLASTGEFSQERTQMEAILADDDSKMLSTTPMLGSILPPPTRLIRDDLQRLREKDEYKGAFYARDEKDDEDDLSLRDLGTNVEEELSFREMPFEISDEDIRMSEGGDQEVAPEGSFRPDEYPEEAQSSSKQDVQQEKG